MAVRDRNMFAWQAYVITMAFVSVGLLLGMFFLWRSYSDLSKRYEDQGSQLSTAQTQVQLNDGRVDRMLSMMGYGNYTQEDLDSMAQKFATDEKLGQVETDFDEKMKQSMSSLKMDYQDSTQRFLGLQKIILQCAIFYKLVN